MRVLFLFILSFFCVTDAVYAACSNPVGAEGDIMYNGTYNAPAYCDNTNWIAMAGADVRTLDYKPNAVAFDGSTCFNGQGNLAPESKVWSGSVWVKIPSFAGGRYLIYNSAVRGRFSVETDGSLSIFHSNDGGTRILDIETASSTLSENTWHHILFSFDLSNPANRYVYVDDTQVALIVNDYFEDLMDHDRYDNGIGGNSNCNANWLNGDAADLWMDFGTYIDLSVEANRRKFIKANGNPAYLGENGELPTGSAPDIFLSGATDSWHTNKGTGGGFTENGALTTAASTPYVPRTDVVPSGLVGHWRLDETSGTTAYDSSGYGNDGILTLADFATDSIDAVINRGYTNITNGNVLQATSADFPTGVDPAFTFSIWLRADIAYGRIFQLSNGDSITIRGWGLEGTYVPALRVNVNGSDIPNGVTGGNTNISYGYELGEWFLFTVTYDGSDLLIYKNGELEVDLQDISSNGYSMNIASPANLGIASSSTGTADWQGARDDARLYNRALGEDEIRELYEARDGIRYNGDQRKMEYFDGNRWVSMTPAWQEVDEGPIYTYPDLSCPNIGDTCSDGSVYAGLSPDGYDPFYITPNDLPGTFPFNDGVALSSQNTSNLVECPYGGPLTEGCVTGKKNTNILAVSDANDDVSGLDPNMAALACYCLGETHANAPNDNVPSVCTGDPMGTNGLDGYGRDDWYLPALAELDIIYSNLVSPDDPDNPNYLDGFDMFDSTDSGSRSGSLAGSFAIDNYWSSSEVNQHSAWEMSMNSGRFVRSTNSKLTSSPVRCARKAERHLDSMGGLVGHWKMDETSGTTVADSSGNGLDAALGSNDGIANISEITTKGPVGSAFDMGYRNARFKVNYDPLLNTQTVTLAAWVKFNLNNSVNRIFTKSNDYQMEVNTGTGRLFMKKEAGTTAYYDIPSLEEDRWYHIASSYNNATNEVKFYVDGVFVDSSIAVLDYDLASTDLLISDPGTRSVLAIDDVRIYDRVLTDDEVSLIYNMGAPDDTSTALPQGCPNVGDVCDDGTIYAGLSPDGSVEMFAAPQDAPTGLPFNNGNSADYVVTSVTDDNTGEANTTALVAIDSDSGTAGFQPHQAAQYCYDLVSNGADDWYLPATSELDMLYDNLVDQDGDNTPGGPLGSTYNFNTGASFPQHSYWYSREYSNDQGGLIRFTDGAGAAYYPSKEYAASVRCVRKGPAPRCANPYGIEGSMMYNATHDVVQYCDGARWVAIGKRN